MLQRHEKIPERVSAEEGDGLDIFFWAYSEELYDCHPIWMEGYLKNEAYDF